MLLLMRNTMTRRFRSPRSSLITGGVAALVFLAAPMSTAQDRGSNRLADARWSPWLGCWTPVERKQQDQSVQVCVLPTSDGAGVRMMTFASGQRILDEPVVADGARRGVDEEGCIGSVKSTWSRDAARVFRVSELKCQGKAPQNASAISTITSPNEWLDIQVATDGRESVRTRHYVRSSAEPPASIDQEIRSLRPSAISAPNVTVDAVVEANALVSSRAVEAWLAEADARVPVNKRTLIKLADADVSKNVIDLLVALAYPEHFEIHRGGSAGSFGSLAGFDDFGLWSDPWGVSFDPFAYYYSPFGSYPGALDPYYVTVGGYVATPGGNTAAASGRGHVVNGSGYTQVEPRQPPPAVVRPSGDSNPDSYTASSAPTPSDSGSGSASPSGYSSGGSGGGQTAVPR
jgi:hypothetical protein